MVATRGKKRMANTNRTLEEKEAAENGLAEIQSSDSLTVDVVEPEEDIEAAENGLAEIQSSDSLAVDVVEPEEDTELEDVVGLVTDEARPENLGEMPQGDGEKLADIDNEDPSMPVAKLNGDDTKTDSTENTFEDNQEDILCDDEEENFEPDTEEKILDEYDVGEEEYPEDDDGGGEGGGEEATEEDEVSDEEEEEVTIEENNQEGKGNAKLDIREVKAKEDGGETKEHCIEKSEASLKNIKSNGRTGKKKVHAIRLKKVDSPDKPEPSHKRKVKKRVESMGMIFMCSSETKKDCYQYKVLGLPESKKDIVEKIYTGMRLFLYDVDLKLMYGIYKAAGPGGYNIEPKAFKQHFPSQVRFKVMEKCLPLAEEKFKEVIQANYFTRTKFDCKLNSEQVKKLCRLFTVSSKGRPSKKLGRSLKAEKKPQRRERNKEEKTGDKRRLPLREDARHHEHPRKHQRMVIRSAAVARQRLPAALPSTIPSVYGYNRASDADAYRQERNSPYRERRDRPLIPLDPYGGARDPPPEHHRDGRDPHLERSHAYRDGRDSHIVRHDIYMDGTDSYSRRHDPDPYRDGRAPYLEPRDPYRDGRAPYLEPRDPYRDGQDPYIQRRDSYRDGQASYLDGGFSYGESTHSELYSSYRRHPLSDSRDVYREDRGVEFRDSYRRDELLGHRVLHPLDSETRNHHGITARDAYLPSRERLSYVESLYPSAYASRANIYR